MNVYNIGSCIRTCFESVNELLSTPMLILVFAAGIIMTWAFDFVQVRYFIASWRYIFKPDNDSADGDGNISSLQAFLGALSTSMGNGSLAGMGVAIFKGGPGAAFWLFVLGFFTMVIRFAEIYASTAFTKQTEYGVRGGPMVYLSRVPGGSWLPYVYTFFALLLALVTGNAMQCNSMTAGLHSMTAIRHEFIAILLFMFLLYVVFGGAQRIMKFSDALAPIKVILFSVTTLTVIAFFYTEILNTFVIIFNAAFSREAFIAGLVGHTMMNAIRFGVAYTLSATEAGLGNAGILFGAAGNVNPTKSGIMSMASTFIATQIVCFLMMFTFVVSGVWNNGMCGMPLVIAAYSTVFGALGGWVATILSVMFGMGVLVAYAFVGRECWLFLTHGRWIGLYYALYCSMSLVGALISVGVVWCVIELIIAGLVFCNIYGLLFLLPQMRKDWRNYLN